MKRNISEDLPARKFAPAASTGGGPAVDSGGGDMEKKAKQCVYDARYKVRKEMGPDSRMDPASVTKAVLEKIDSSEYSQPIKARARKIVMGDTQVREMKEFASQNVARALYSVFVEQPSRVIDEEYIEELKRELSEADQGPEERKYKVRVTDKDTKNSYIRWANRPKINELRANPNIVSVEMLDLYGSPEPNESERTKGAQTASVTAGKGLAKRDYDEDGKVESGAKEYRGSVHNAIQRKMGGSPDGKDTSSVREEFIGEKDNGGKNPQITPMPPKKKNNYIVHDPSKPQKKDVVGLMAHNELEGEMIAETGYSKFLDMIQEKKLTKAEKAKKEQIVKSLKPKYGKTSKTYAIATSVAKRVAEEKEEKKSEEPGCEDDSRAKYAEREVIKNRLRAALGIKNPIVMTAGYNPEGKLVDEARAEERRGFGSTGTQRQKQKSGESGPTGERPVTSYSGGQNPHTRGKSYLNKTQRRASSRRYLDQPGGVYAAPENNQGKNTYLDIQTAKRNKSNMSTKGT
jgi:hypothetical protein